MFQEQIHQSEPGQALEIHLHGLAHLIFLLPFEVEFQAYIQEFVGNPEIRFLNKGEHVIQVDQFLICSSFENANGAGDSYAAGNCCFSAHALIDEQEVGPYFQSEVDCCNFPRIQ